MAVKLLDRVSIGSNNQYEVQIIDGQNRKWLRLSDKKNFKKAIATWSEKVNNIQKNNIQENYKNVITQLSSRLASVIKGQKTLTEAIRFWPVGWEYWTFTPEPIASYFSSGEFENQVNRYNAEKLFDEYLKNVDVQSDYGICLKHVFTLLLELSLPCKKEYGFATMLMFEYSDFTFYDGSVIGEYGISFSRTELGKIISLNFSVICEDQDWWVNQYDKVCLESHISRLAKGIVKKVKTSHLVKSIEASWF